MAIFEAETKSDKTTFIALLDKNGNQMGTIFPVAKLAPELLAEALTEKGLNVEIRESKGDVLKVEL